MDTETNGHDALAILPNFSRRTLREAAEEIREARPFMGGTIAAFMGCMRNDEWARVLLVMSRTDQFA